MKLLLDTHYVVWLTVERQQLTDRELSLLRDPKTDLVASAISLWELRIKWQRKYKSGDTKGPANPADIHDILVSLGIETISLTPAQGIMSLERPINHKDPFDEQLLIQAQQLGCQLLTRDRLLVDHPLAFTAP